MGHGSAARPRPFARHNPIWRGSCNGATEEELNVTKRTPTLVAMSLSVALAATACSSDRDRNAASGNDRSRPAPGGDHVTVAGCLSGGPDGRLVLTAAPDPGVATPARVGMGERDTHSYVLVGGNDLQRHIGRRVEVTGTLVGRQQELERESKSQSESPAATGTSGRDTPTVKTKEEVDLEVRQLNVSTVREVAPSCQLNP
jgi:hypothetical protein